MVVPLISVILLSPSGADLATRNSMSLGCIKSDEVKRIP